MPEFVFKVQISVPAINIIFGQQIDAERNCFDNFRLNLLREFDVLKGASFTMYWIDDNNDTIRITNDDDLRIYMKLKGRKIFVEINDRFDQMRTKSAIDNLVSIAPISPDLHTGIFCDGCNYEIRERRYKCIECGNYDLCFTCEMKKLHSHHMMVRIVEPLSRPISEIIETIKKRRNATIISGQNTALTVRPLSPDILNQNQSNVYTPGGIRGIDHRLDTDFGPLETVLSSSNRSNTATTSTVTVPDNSSNVPQTDTDICEVLFVPIESAASSNFATAMGTPAPLEPAASSNSPTNNFLYGIARDEQPIIQAERPMTSAESSRLAMLEARNYQHRVIEKRSPPE